MTLLALILSIHLICYAILLVFFLPWKGWAELLGLIAALLGILLIGTLMWRGAMVP